LNQLAALAPAGSDSTLNANLPHRHLLSHGQTLSNHRVTENTEKSIKMGNFSVFSVTLWLELGRTLHGAASPQNMARQRQRAND
jgi:hypothetical protein